MKAPQRRCRCASAYERCAACRAFYERRTPSGQHHSYQGIPRRTWATPQDIAEIWRLRGLGYPWVQIVALVGITMGALRAVRRLGLVPAKAKDT